MQSNTDQPVQIRGLSTPEEIRHFLHHNWEQAPRYLPDALPGMDTLVDADELAGLAMLDEVNSRIVQGRHYRMDHGPFDEARLTAFPPKDATLLVQAVDQHLPEVQALRQAFSFIPHWRFEDVMASFATAGGGVGPHFDYYDVFLIQGKGQRCWQLGQRCDSQTACDDSAGQRLLADFQKTAEYTLNPGDILYVPPGLAHWGVSVDDSLCYSVGFRTPSLAECLLEWANRCSPQLNEFQRLSSRPGSSEGSRLPEELIDCFQQQLQALGEDRQAIADVIGVLQSEPSCAADAERASLADCDWPGLRQQLASGAVLLRSPSARSCWFASDSGLQLYHNGQISSSDSANPLWVGLLSDSASLDLCQIVRHCESGDAELDTIHQQLLLDTIASGLWLDAAVSHRG